MITIEAVDGILIGCHTNTANYHETIKRVNRLMRSMSDWMVRSGDAHQRMIDSWAEKRPVCDYCGEHITGEEAVRLNGEWICEEIFSIIKKYNVTRVYHGHIHGSGFHNAKSEHDGVEFKLLSADCIDFCPMLIV